MKWGIFFIIAAVLIVLLIVVGSSRNQKPKEQDLSRIKPETGAKGKKVILLLADSLMSQSIDRGLREKELPTFRFLIEHGQYYKNMVSSFPTMSVTIDSTLLTGRYPSEHRLPGLTWYSAKDKKVINYGTGPIEVLRQGVNNVLTDGLIHLNQDHLNPDVPTIHEELARHGLQSGSINGLIYRGPAVHKLTIPAWLHIPSSLPDEIEVKGPDFLTLGALTNPLEGLADLPDNLTDKIGFNNRFSFETVKYLVRHRKLPDFLFVYLPDLDQELHKNGPSSLKGVKDLDGQLESLLQSFGSREQAMKEAVILISGDSGMTRILPADRNPEIDLSALFGDDRVLSPGEEESGSKDILFTVNETMAYVYSLKGTDTLKEAAKVLQADSRIDFVAWKERDGWVNVIQGGTSKALKYKADGKLQDTYRQSWTIDGDSQVLDLKVNDVNNMLEYDEYPDVLMRLKSALDSHEGDYLVVTAKPGYELKDKNSPTHKGGGGHGSIRKAESLVPLIICGTDRKPTLLRMVDLKSYLLDLLAKNPPNHG
ncbi:alkaline phosphatase family protein [Paenibacillus sp. M1]|uniref:Alkaline phosphatase family protein n=1 Tax=Paenibacillus haidiansis TaxID=1574488 RepID=A0ABU7VVE2_9BACL